MTEPFDVALLELYSGSRVMSKTWEARGYPTFSIDNNMDFDPSLCTDVLYLDPHKLPRPYVIWASVPCQPFSPASRPHYWTPGESKPRASKTMMGLAHLYKTLELIRELKPVYWFIENPRGKMRELFDEAAQAIGVTGYRRVEITYCQYEKPQGMKKPPQKPTDIFTNNPLWLPLHPCKPGASCHEGAPKGVNGKGTQGKKNAYERGKIPFALCEELLDTLEGKALQQPLASGDARTRGPREDVANMQHQNDVSSSLRIIDVANMKQSCQGGMVQICNIPFQEIKDSNMKHGTAGTHQGPQIFKYETSLDRSPNVPHVEHSKAAQPGKATISALIALDIALRGGTPHSIKQSDIRQLSRELGLEAKISRTTVFRILKEFENLGLVEKDPPIYGERGKTYQIGKGLNSILRRYKTKFGIEVSHL